MNERATPLQCRTLETPSVGFRTLVSTPGTPGGIRYDPTPAAQANPTGEQGNLHFLTSCLKKQYIKQGKTSTKKLPFKKKDSSNSRVWSADVARTSPLKPSWHRRTPPRERRRASPRRKTRRGTPNPRGKGQRWRREFRWVLSWLTSLNINLLLKFILVKTSFACFFHPGYQQLTFCPKYAILLSPCK